MAKFNPYRAARQQIRAQQRASATAQAKNVIQHGTATIHSTRAPTSARAQAQRAMQGQQDQARAQANLNMVKYGQATDPADARRAAMKVGTGAAYAGGAAVQELGSTGAGGIAGDAAGRAAGGVKNVAMGAAAGMAMAGPVGAAVGAAVAALAEFTSAVKDTIGKIGSFAEVAMKYNPQAAMAGGMAQVRGQLGDMNRAQSLGPKLAGFIDAKSRLGQQGEDLMAKLLKPLIPLATNFMENMLRFIEWVEPFLIDWLNGYIVKFDILLMAADFLVNLFGETGIHFKLVELIEHNTRKDAKSPFEQFRNFAGNFGGARPDPEKFNRQQPLGLNGLMPIG